MNKHNELLQLALLFYKEHNRLATILGKKFPYWSDDQIFHEAKAIVIGELQTIVLKELTLGLLGPSLVNRFHLSLDKVDKLVQELSATDKIGPSSVVAKNVLKAIWLTMMRPLAT